MEIIAVSNIKGGVGKTTTVVNLAYLSAASGRPTLLWDLDPQGAATYTLHGEPNVRASAKKLVSGKQELLELIVPTTYEHLELLPADFSYRHFDQHMSERKQQRAAGIDDRPVVADLEELQVSTEETFDVDSADHARLQSELAPLADRSGARLRAKELVAGCVTVKSTKNRHLDQAVDQIRDRFGASALTRASSLERAEDDDGEVDDR